MVITEFSKEQMNPGKYVFENNNVIFKENMSFVNSKITFKGTGNILFFEKGLRIQNSNFSFLGNNSIVYLSSNKYPSRISAALHNNCAIYVGRDTLMSSPTKILSTEGENVFIGNDCLIAQNVVLRNSDAHAVYTIDTGLRINYPKSVFIGDHVWIGIDSLILKGSQIGSGSIVGARSLVSQRFASNCIIGGLPARVIKKGVFFEHQSTHTWTATEIQEHQKNDNDKFVYDKDCTTIDINEFLNSLQSCSDVYKKLDIYIGVSKITDKNRFYIGEE